jgi:hypothetical protein
MFPVKTRKLLAVQAIRTTWSHFYNDFESDTKFRVMVKQLVKMSQAEISNDLQRIRFTQTDKITDIEKRVLDIPSDLGLFLQEADEAIFGIADWRIYRRATASTVNLGMMKSRKR